MQNRIWFEKYRELQVLSNHRDTIVYLAQHVKLLSKCIIKEIKKESDDGQPLSEARILKSLKHPNIPQIYDIYETQDAVYIIEEYMEGQSLRSICESEQLSEKTIISYGIQLCELINYLHNGQSPILYLDLKPDNLLVYQEKVFLIDFGAACFLAEEEQYHNHYGTPWYAAPEQYEESHLSVRTDIYGVGMVLYYMVTGRKYQNQKGENIDKVKRCSKQLAAIINRCLRFHPTQRYSTIQKVSNQLSLLYQKQRNKDEKKELLCFAVAGTQCHIGTTHISLQLCEYLRRNQHRCLYVEKNTSGAAKELIKSRMTLPKGSYVYEYQGIPILPYQNECRIWTELCREYDSIVYDYGVLDEENSQDFLQCMKQFIVYGSKEWERANISNAMMHIKSSEEICFLGNYQTVEQYQEAVRLFPNMNCYRVPYEPRIIEYEKRSSTYRMFQQLIK